MSEFAPSITSREAEAWANKQLASAGYDCSYSLPFLSVNSDWRIFLYASTFRKRDRLTFHPWYFISSSKVDEFLQGKGLIQGNFVRLLMSDIFRIVPGCERINVLTDRDGAFRQFTDIAMGAAIDKLTQHCSFDYVRDNMRFPGVLPDESLGYFGLLFINGFEKNVKRLIEDVLAEPEECPLVQHLIWKRRAEFFADCQKFYDAVFEGRR